MPLDAQLLLVGDIDQVPSVGLGNVLLYLIAKEQVPVVRLTQVLRQAALSEIVSNAHRINSRQFPKLAPISQTQESDCLGVSVGEPEDGVQAIRELVTNLIPKIGLNPATDLQVLCPATLLCCGNT